MIPQALPLGASIPPNDLHGVSVSIPTVEDAIKHEQGDSKTLAVLEQATRAIEHRTFSKLCAKSMKKKSRPQGNICKSYPLKQ